MRLFTGPGVSASLSSLFGSARAEAGDALWRGRRVAARRLSGEGRVGCGNADGSSSAAWAKIRLAASRAARRLGLMVATVAGSNVQSVCCAGCSCSVDPAGGLVSQLIHSASFPTGRARPGHAPLKAFSIATLGGETEFGGTWDIYR